MSQPQLALPVDITDTGETRVYRMLLPFLPPSKNVYDGYPTMWKSGVKKKWIKHVTEQAAALQMPLGIDKVGLSATLVFPTKARRDLSNYAQCLWNFVPDALQRCGVLTDDSDGHVEFGPNLGVKFAYDTRTQVAKVRRQRTVVRVAMHVPAGGQNDG